MAPILWQKRIKANPILANLYQIIKVQCSLLAPARVQTNSFGHALIVQIMKCFYVYNHNLCSKQSQLGTHLLCFFKITFLLDFTPKFSIWSILKKRFVKKFENKNLQIFYTLNLEVSEHIMNRFWTKRKFFSKKFNLDFGPYFGISLDFTNMFSVFWKNHSR